MRSAITASLCLFLGCASSNSSAPKHPSGAPELEKVVEEYIDGTLEENPALAIGLGLHQYDGRIPELGDAAAEKAVRRAKAFLEATASFDPAALPDPLRLDLQLTRLDAQQTVFRLDTLKAHKKILFYGGLFDVSAYLVRDYAPLEQRVSSMLDHAEAATRATETLLATLNEQQVRTHLETAVQMFDGMVVFYRTDVATISAPALEANAELKARYDRAVPAAMEAMQGILKWIADRTPNATEDFALGTEKFLTMLRANEGLDTTLEELERTAEADFLRNRDAFVETAKKIDPDAPVEAVIERVMNDRLPEQEVLETARVQAKELRRFIEEQKIITIPSDAECDVKETPPFMRWNSAFLDPAGPFEKSEESFYYISPPDPSWPKEVQEQYIPWEGDLLATSIHEVYPGHFLHNLWIRRAPSRASKIFSSYAFTEGWAHYTEQMILDAGYGHDDPRLRLGQLSNALLRNCRFLAAIGLHTRGMTVDQAKELFQQQCFIDPGNAQQQAYRGTFDPGYLSYTLGKIQILEVRNAFFQKRGTTDLRAFHDWLLSLGAPPVALLEQRL